MIAVNMTNTLPVPDLLIAVLYTLDEGLIMIDTQSIQSSDTQTNTSHPPVSDRSLPGSDLD